MEQPPRDHTTYRIVIVIVMILFVGFLLFGRTWIACQQLAPIERMFVRGC